MTTLNTKCQTFCRISIGIEASTAMQKEMRIPPRILYRPNMP